MLEFSDDTIQKVAPHFGDRALYRGLNYAKQGRVKMVKSEGWPVVAEVRGTARYIVSLEYESSHDYLYSECSCPVGQECKHGVAVALVLFEERAGDAAERKRNYQAQAVGNWLAKMGGSTLAHSTSVNHPKRIAYILQDGDSPKLSIHQTSLLKRGGYSRSTPLPSISDPYRSIPDWLGTEDLRIISAVRSMARANPYDTEHSIETLDDALFREMADTKRLFWHDVKRLPLTFGPPRSATLAWQKSASHADGYKLGVEGSLHILATTPNLYVDPANGILGTLELGVPAAMVAPLINGPAVPKSMLPTAEKSLRSLLLPKVAAAVFPEAAKPQQHGEMLPRLYAWVGSDYYGATIEFSCEARYGDIAFPLAQWQNIDDSETQIIRDMGREGHCRARLQGLTEGAFRKQCGKDRKQKLASARFIAQQLIPVLDSEGWLCELSEDFPVDLPVMSPQWVEDIDATSEEHNWFEIGLGVTVDGKTVQLLPVLLEAIGDGKINFEDGTFSSAQPAGVTLKLPSGEMVYVPQKRIERWLRPLMELQLRGLDEDDKLIVPAISVAEVAEDLPMPFSQAGMLEELGQRLANLVNLKPATPSTGFVGNLRNYQQQGLAWLRFIHDSGYGGLLTDDMGLGKTVQLLAFIDGLRASRKLPKNAPVLVVAPRSVVGNWHSETQTFTPKLTSMIHLGAGRTREPKELCKARIVITSYQTLLRDIALFKKVPWTSIVFDEAQALKNPSTKLRRGVVGLKSLSRFCVTGTPIENHLGELWSQVDLIMPGLLGTKKTFDLVFRRPIEKEDSSEALELMQKRIRPFLLRRTKAEVDIDLPEKTEIIERIAFEPAQRDLYESLRLVLDKQVRGALKARGVNGSAIVVLDALLRLRQCCCDPRLVKLPMAQKAKKSAKLERLLAMLEELVDAGRSVLVFSQFTSMLQIIEDECVKAGIGYVKLTGQTRDRESMIEKFQAGGVPVFLISLKAGGVGLNLTRADTVIHYDPWWNPAVENQATDRAHRIGQENNVMVYKLVAENTLEERICVMQKKKQHLTDSALHEGGLTHFGAEDLMALFQSL